MIAVYRLELKNDKGEWEKTCFVYYHLENAQKDARDWNDHGDGVWRVTYYQTGEVVKDECIPDADTVDMGR